MGPSCYIEYRGIRNRTIRGFYCSITSVLKFYLVMLCVSVPEGGPRTPMGEGRAAYRRGGEGEYKTNWWVSARKTCNSSALAMELRLSCINPWKWYWMKGQVDTQKWDNMRLSEFVMILILWPSEIWLGLRQYPHVQGVINTTDQSVSILVTEHGSTCKHQQTEVLIYSPKGKGLK